MSGQDPNFEVDHYYIEWVKNIQDGLKILGFPPDFLQGIGTVFTNEQLSNLDSISKEIIYLMENLPLESLESDIERLSRDAFLIIEGRLMEPEILARRATQLFERAYLIKDVILLIEQSIACYYNQFYTACLSLLFIILEHYLRGLAEWTPHDGHITFNRLKSTILSREDILIDEKFRNEAYEIVSFLYQHYNALSPPEFHFNRHGLLHGIRGNLKSDRLNCLRMYRLFLLFCRAEGLESKGLYGASLKKVQARLRIYERYLTNPLPFPYEWQEK